MLTSVMKAILKFLLVMVVSFTSISAQQLDFIQNKNSAGKASLTSDAYYSNFVLGTANFSPELRLPVQIFYDSSVKEEGLAGFGWKIPQLESSATPNEHGAVWTTPWGEKVFFYSRKNTSRDVLNLYNERERENAYFSPFADWTANGRADSGSWTIFGRKDMRGWKFVYTDAKLRKIEAPSGQCLSFIYNNGKLVSVEQLGRAFIELKYGEDKNLSEIVINGISNKLKFISGTVRILPETLAGKEEMLKTPLLSSIGQEGLNPLEFSYNKVGYLTQIKRGEYVDKISVEQESVAQRKAYLKQIAAAQKAKKPINGIKKEKTDGRIIADSQLEYFYPNNKIGNIKIVNKLGQTASFAFDSQKGVSTKRDFSGKETSTYYFMRYDVAYNGKVRQIVDSRKRVLASCRYDKDTGKVLRSRDLAKNDINYKYDKAGNLTLITKRGANESSVSPVRSFEYAKGNLHPTKINELNEKGEIARTTTIQYNKDFRPIFVNDGQQTTKIAYNSFGYPSKTENVFGRETEFTYDKYNRITSKSVNGIKYNIEYNKNGLPVKYTSQYDNEVISTTEITYDKNAAPVAYKDQDGLTKKYERNALGNIVREIFPDNTEVNYTYNDLGRLTNVIDQSGHAITFTWNQFGLDSRTTAIGQVTQNYYDDFGRLKAVDSKFENQPADRSFDYKYDNLDRTIEIKYGKNEIERIKYDSWGRIVEKFKNGRGSNFKYDHFGRLIEKNEDNVLIRYVYDNYGRRILSSANKDKDIWNESNTYDKYGRLVKTESSGKSVEYIYNSKNQLSEQIVDGNKIKFSYTKLGQLERKILFDKDGKELSELRYFYSKSGKIISRLANGKLQSYKYDAKNQLISVYDEESESFVEKYVYDPSGNILRKTINGETTTYTYDAANQLVSSVSSDDKLTNYAYDAAGRMIREGNKTYEYGWLDKVMRVAESGKEVARFEYQSNGQVSKVIREHEIETFEWDGLSLVKRNERRYINEPQVGGGNPILVIDKNTEVMFADKFGTTIGSVNKDKYVAIERTTFGDSSSSETAFFTGKPFLSELGYVFLLRNYKADTCKWLSQDLIGYPDGWNNLMYCNNSLGVDIFGAWTIPGVVVGMIGDYQGRVILDHWLEGTGSPLIFGTGDATWANYMRANSTLRRQIDNKLTQDAKDRTSEGTINENFHAVIENGYTTGYEYLHGTNGGLDVRGDISAIESTYGSYRKIELIYDVTMTWNDIIDPNEAYERDRILAAGAQWIYNPQDYFIKISWKDQFKFTRYLPKEEEVEE